MKRRTRIVYTDAQKAEMWDRWRQGESMHEIARAFDRYHPSISRILTENGGIRPKPRRRAACALTLAEREASRRMNSVTDGSSLTGFVLAMGGSNYEVGLLTTIALAAQLLQS